MNIKITGTGIYLPPYIETSKETAKLINKSEEWIISKTGVTERRKSEIDVDKMGKKGTTKLDYVITKKS